MGVVEPRAFRQFDVYLVSLDPTVGSEIQKTRPCVIVSPNEMNFGIATVIIAPLTSAQRTYTTRVPCQFQGKNGQIALDQLRTVDKTRLAKRLGTLERETSKRVLQTLVEMFTLSQE
jgi:mRNA interferase MazF